MFTRRSWLIYGIFLAIWIALIGWQVAEHLRVKKLAQTESCGLNDAKSASSSLAVLVRSGSFFGVADTNRLESALRALVTNTGSHLASVLLLNARDEELVSAGTPIDFQRIADAETNGGAQ